MYELSGSKRKYGVTQHALMRDVSTWWNSGAGLDPDSAAVAEWLESIAKRARHDATAQRSSVRAQFKGKAVTGR